MFASLCIVAGASLPFRCPSGAFASHLHLSPRLTLNAYRCAFTSIGPSSHFTAQIKLLACYSSRSFPSITCTLFCYFTILLFYCFTGLLYYTTTFSLYPPPLTHSLTYFPASTLISALCFLLFPPLLHLSDSVFRPSFFFFFFLICCLSPLPSLVIIHSSKTTNLLQPRLCRFSLSSSRFVFFGLLSSLISHLSLHQNKNKKEKKNHPTATFVVANPAFAQINNLWPPSNQLAKYQQIKIRAH